MQESNHDRRVIVPEALDAPYQPYRPSMSDGRGGHMMPIDSMMRDLYVVQREINQGSHQLYLFFDTFTHRPAPLNLKKFDLKNPQDAQWYNFAIYFIVLLIVVVPTILTFILKKKVKIKLIKLWNNKEEDQTHKMKRFLDFIKENRMMIVIIVFLIAILLSMVNLSIPLEKEYEYRADPFFVIVCFSSIAVSIVSLNYVIKGLNKIKVGGDTTLVGKNAFQQTLAWGALGIWAMGFMCYFIGMYSLGTQKSVLASIVRPALESGKMFVLSDSVKEISFTLRNNGAFMGFYTLCKLTFLLISSFAVVSLVWSRINSYWSILDRTRNPGDLYVFFGINDNTKILAHDVAQNLKAELIKRLDQEKEQELRKKLRPIVEQKLQQEQDSTRKQKQKLKQELKKNPKQGKKRALKRELKREHYLDQLLKSKELRDIELNAELNNAVEKELSKLNIKKDKHEAELRNNLLKELLKEEKKELKKKLKELDKEIKKKGQKLKKVEKALEKALKQEQKQELIVKLEQLQEKKKTIENEKTKQRKKLTQVQKDELKLKLTQVLNQDLKKNQELKNGLNQRLDQKLGKKLELKLDKELKQELEYRLGKKQNQEQEKELKKRRDYTIVMVECRNNPNEGMGNGMTISSLAGMFNFRKDAYAEVRKISSDALLVVSESAISCRECSEQVNESMEDNDAEKEKRYELFNALGLKNLSKMIKNANDSHFFFLDDDDRANIDATDNLHKMIYLAHNKDLKGKPTIYCLARKNAFSTLLEKPLNSRSEKDDKIQVKILDLSVMAAQSLFLSPENHPINFVECDTETATVKSRFESLVIGFGRGGRDIVRYLYEFGAFLDHDIMKNDDTGNNQPMPKRVHRSPFQCTILDKNITKIEPRYMARIPEVKAAHNNNDENDPLLRFEEAALNSAYFVELVETQLKKSDTMNFVVISIGDDKTNMGALTFVLDQAIRVRKGKLGKLRIFVRNYDPNYESVMKEQEKNFNNLLGQEVVTIFGNRSALLTSKMIVDDNIVQEANEFHHIYNKMKNDPTIEWDKRQNKDRSTKAPRNGERLHKKETIWNEQSRKLRIKTQDIHSSMHIDTKLRLIGIARQNDGKIVDENQERLLRLMNDYDTSPENVQESSLPTPKHKQPNKPLLYLNLARNEHIRRVACLEMMGYEKPVLGTIAEPDEAAKIHPCLVDWDDLDEVSSFHNQAVPDHQIDFKKLDYLIVRSTFKLANNELDKEEKQKPIDSDILIVAEDIDDTSIEEVYDEEPEEWDK